MNKATPNKLEFDKESAKELFGFGKWILFSTALMFLGSQADRMLLGKLFTMTLFGVYGVALNFAELPKKIIERFSNDILFPIFSNYSYLPNHELRKKVANPRLRLLLLLALMISFLGCFGDFIIKLLYDKRYIDAAWILPLLSFGMWPLILKSTIESSLLSIGKPKYMTFGNLAKFIYMIIFIPLSFLGISCLVQCSSQIE